MTDFQQSMQVRYLFIILILCICNNSYSQSISLVDNQTASILANRLIGSGVTLPGTGLSLNCNSLANGLFVNVNPFPTQSLAIDSGIVLCTGRVLSTSSDTGINANRFRLASNNLGISSSDAEISTIAGSTAIQKDLCFLEFHFIPKGDSAFIDYVFASEDYPEYACSQFYDAVGIFVSPPSGSFTNYAKVPGTSINVSINSINDTTKQTGVSNYATYCTSLGAGAPFIQYYTDNLINNHIVYDGMTKVLRARIPVSPNLTHTMKVAIADIKDANFDSGIFLKQFSLTSPPLLEIVEKKSTNNLTTNPLYLIEGCNPGSVKFSRSTISSALTVNVAFSGTASTGDYSGGSSFTIPVGSSTFTYNISAVLDALTETPETLKLTFTCPALSFTDSANFIIKDFANGLTVFNTSNDTTICNNSSVTLGYTRTDTMFTGVWTPSTNLSCTNCVNPIFTANNGNIFSTQIVNLRISATGCSAVDSPITIKIQPKPNISLAPSYTICKGDSVTINASAGPAGGTYSYSWSPNINLSSTTISNPIAKPSATQIYKVVVNTTAGCKDSLTTTVNISNIRNEIDSMRTSSTTCGTSNGNISLYARTAAPFNPPYQYSINGGSSYVSTNTFNGLSAGTYNVSIKNASNCRFDTILTITAGAGAPSAVYTQINTSCGLNNGSAKVTSKSGKAPLTLTWKLGSTIISTDTFIDNRPSGVYTLMVTDSAGCVTQYAVNILSSTGVTLGFSKTDQTCGLNNGSIIASPTGGVSPYTYSWNTGQTSNSISGLVAGKYIVTVTDGNGCTNKDSVTLASFPAIVSGKSGTNATCGSVNGSATATVVSGGTSPFIYAWSNGVISPVTTNTSHTVSGLSGGKYTFTITDAKGCSKIDSFTVLSSPNVSFSLSSTNSICGNPNGTITLTILTGTANYTYAWNDGANTKNRSGLTVGTYTVTVTDANGCTATLSANISTNSSPSLSISKVDATCGKNNGRIFSSVSGAKPPITYLWNNGKATSFIDSLAAGIYTLTITDSFGCQKVVTDTVKMIPFANFNDSIIQPSCGNNNGSIILSNITGKAPVTITWSDGSSAVTRTGLPSGSYSVIVQDSLGCSKSKTFVLNSSSSPTINFTITHALCSATKGSIVSGVSNGTIPYSYAWSSGETTPNILNKNPGTYTLTVTDQKGCTRVATDSILRKPSPTYKDTMSKSKCGINNGWIMITNLVGSGPITYAWSHDATLNQPSVFGLSSIVHFLTITDGNGCQVLDTFDISSNGAISLTSVVKQPTCKDSNGKITLTMIGGNAPYNILWSNGDTGVIADTLKHGKYGFSIVDKLGCTYSDSIKVNDSTKLKDSFQVFKTRCDSFTGKIIAFPYGGVPPYKFQWSRKAKDTFATIDSLTIGLYNLQTIDSNGCKFDTSVNIFYDHTPIISDSLISERCDSFNAKAYIKIDSVITPLKIYWNGVLDSTYVKTGLSAPQSMTVFVIDSQKCIASRTLDIPEIPVSYPSLSRALPPCGNNLGSLTVQMNNPKKYLWSTGDTTGLIDSLSPGAYSVTITDTTGCKFVRKDSLYYSIPPVRNYNTLRPNCGRNDGSVKAIIGSLYGGFTYTWYKIPGGATPNPGADSVIFSNLDSGLYRFNIVDAVGCIRSDTIYLKDSAAPSLQFLITNSNCVNGVGKVKAIPQGGASPYSYLWYNFTTKDSIINLNSGNYPLTVTDSRNCSVVKSASISYTPNPELNLIGVNSKCGPNNGKIVTNVSFGKPPYRYNWSNGDTTKNISGLTAGQYKLTITDSVGCTDIDSITITSEPKLDISITSSVAFCDLNNGSASVSILSGKSPYTYNWNGTVPSLSISGLDSGFHIFQIIDSNQCVIIDTIHIDRVSKPVISQTVVNDNCTYNLGKITTSTVGGKAPLTYSWSNGSVNASLTNIGAGTYTLSVTDSLGCLVTKSAIVGDTAGPIVSLVVTDATCGLMNGSINANVTSTRTPLSYFWNNVSGSTSITGINGGKFVFKVIDNRSCVKLDSVIIDTIKVLTATKSIKQASCNLNNAYIKLNAKGGIGAYTYTWGHTAINTDSVFGLSPGKYRVTLSDTKGCLWIDSFDILQLGFPTVNFNKNAATCRAANGSITAVVTNVSGTYTYLWNSGDTTATISNKSANTYSLTISDGLGCSVNYTTTLTSIGVDSIDFIIKQPVCDINNGKIKVVPFNTVGSKTYLWSSTPSSLDSIVNLGGGTYSITVTDNLCTFSKSTTLIMAKSPVLLLTKQDASCGINNGRALTSFTFGTSPFSYEWNNAATSVNLFNIDSGSYTVIITDSNNCKDTASIYIPRIPKLTANFSIQKSTCGNANGSIQTTITGGKPNFIFAWSNGTNTANQNNILAGTYVLTVSDNGNCTITENVVVDDRKKPQITTIVTNAVCSKNNGAIDVTIKNGNPPFTYSWNTGATSEDLINLASGIYRLKVTDSIGCVDSSSILVDNGLTPKLSVLELRNSTCGLANGRIALELPRGVDPIVYTWSTGLKNDTISNIPSGKYFVTVTDARQCEIIDSFTITTSTTPKITFSTTNSYCGKSNGAIQVNVNLGTPSFKYLWNTGATTQDLNNVPKGSYTLVVLDSFNCKDSARITVNEDKNNVFASIQKINLICYNDNSGKVILTPSGGEYPYTYDVNSPAPDSIIYNLSARLYNYTVTDNKGCIYKDTFSLSEPAPLSISLIKSKNLLCFNEPTGEIEVRANGGTSPYFYQWTPSNKVGDKISGLSAGVHNAIVTDINGCKASFNTTLTEPTEIRVFPSIINNLCNGQSNAKIDLNVSQGTPPYSYQWSNGATAKDIAGLKEGLYKVSIFDNNNCLDVFTYSLSDPLPLQSGNVIPQGLKCKGFIDGQIEVNGVGGTIPYMYSIDSGKTFVYKNLFTNLFAGNYRIIIKDRNDCRTFVNSTVDNYPAFSILAYPRDTSLELDESVMLGYDVIQGNPSWINKTLWSSGEGLSCVDCINPLATTYQDKTYIVEVTYLNKCLAYDTVRIRVLDNNKLFIPNAFAPNSLTNTENKTFKIYSNNLISAHLMIYNRWGEKVFETREAHKTGWDGYFKGEAAPMGIYTFTLEATYLNQRKVEHKGTFTLIR